MWMEVGARVQALPAGPFAAQHRPAWCTPAADLSPGPGPGCLPAQPLPPLHGRLKVLLYTQNLSKMDHYLRVTKAGMRGSGGAKPWRQTGDCHVRTGHSAGRRSGLLAAAQRECVSTPAAMPPYCRAPPAAPAPIGGRRCCRRLLLLLLPGSLHDHCFLQQVGDGLARLRAHCGRGTAAAARRRVSLGSTHRAVLHLAPRGGTAAPFAPPIVARQPAAPSGCPRCPALSRMPRPAAPRHRPARTRQPLLDGRRVEVGLLVQRVVPAQVLQRRAVSPHTRVHRDDAVKRQLLAAHAREADLRGGGGRKAGPRRSAWLQLLPRLARRLPASCAAWSSHHVQPATCMHACMHRSSTSTRELAARREAVAPPPLTETRFSTRGMTLLRGCTLAACRRVAGGQAVSLWRICGAFAGRRQRAPHGRG